MGLNSLGQLAPMACADFRKENLQKNFVADKKICRTKIDTESKVLTARCYKACHEKLSKVKKQKEKNSKIRKRNFLNRTDNMTKKKIQKNDLLERTLAENLCCRKENVQNKN